MIPIDEFKPEKKDPSDQELLEGHFTWETDWLAKTLKEEKLNSGKKSAKIDPKRSGLAWHFVMPKKLKAGVPVKEETTGEAAAADEVASLPYAQCYLTMIVQQNVILMNTMVKDKKGLADAQKFLLAEMKKVQFAAEAIDYKEVQERLREEQEKLDD